LTGLQNPDLRNATIRLLVIPFAVYTAWMLETFLLEGSTNLFVRFDPAGLFLYTIIACIITGMILPLLCIRKAFITGAVNTFQIGFRSFRRTILACVLTCIIGYGAVIIFSPFGTDRLMFANAFLLLLPGAIASVMICFVLIGTHIQAFVRSGGALLSLSLGIMVMAMLFGMTIFAYFPAVMVKDTVFVLVGVGIIAGLFFFAVRDVYATTIVVGGCSVFIYADRINPQYLHNAVPGVWISAGLAVFSLIGIHLYLARNFTTIMIPDK
jgi:hypothetical protein